MAVSEVVNQAGGAPICLVCEHAGNVLPVELNRLGLSDRDLLSHAVYDIGAEDLAREMAERLDAPLVLARISRLVCDLNRPPGSPASTPSRVESIDIPGNEALTEASRIDRAKSVYHPFHNEVRRVLSTFDAPPAFVTVHSFTPSWNGVPRDTEIGLLHDADSRLAQAMLARAKGGFRVELNQPYSAKDGVTHTLQRHASTAPSVMIEVRNDLLGSPQGVAKAAETLSLALTSALTDEADT